MLTKAIYNISEEWLQALHLFVPIYDSEMLLHQACNLNLVYRFPQIYLRGKTLVEVAVARLFACQLLTF